MSAVAGTRVLVSRHVAAQPRKCFEVGINTVMLDRGRLVLCVWI